MAFWQQLFLLLIWILWGRDVHPQLPQVPNMPDLVNAAKAVTETAQKWGAVADAFLSWHLPAAFVLGAVMCFLLVSLWQRNKTTP